MTGSEAPLPPWTAIEAVVFDCDGTLVDTERSWRQSYAEIFSRHGRDLTDTDYAALCGQPFEELGLILSDLLKLPRGHAERLHSAALDLVTEIRASCGVLPMPGAVELVERLSGSHPLAVASSGSYDHVAASLRSIGLLDAFRVLATGDDVAEPKPAPDVYLLACRRLGVAPGSSLAFEDSAVGVTSARRAGMYVVAVPSMPGCAGPAHVVASSLLDPALRTALPLPGRR